MSAILSLRNFRRAATPFICEQFSYRPFTISYQSRTITSKTSLVHAFFQEYQHEVQARNNCLKREHRFNVQSILKTDWTPQWPEVAKTIDEWYHLAQHKKNEARQISRYQAEVFTDSAEIIIGLNSVEIIPKTYTMLIVCKDQENNIQALARVSEPYHTSQQTSLIMQYLATHPKNIRSIVNQQEFQVRGASTAIISHLAECCLRKGFSGIQLEPLEHLNNFYKSFTSMDGRWVELTTEKIRTLPKTSSGLPNWRAE